MQKLKLSTHLVISNDGSTGNNPLRRPVDWSRGFSDISVQRSKTEVSRIVPGDEIVIFNGSYTLTANVSTAYGLAVSALDTSRYRLTWTGAGTTPGFRAARAVAAAGGNLTLTLNSNQTLTVVSSLGAIFGSVVVGDVAFIPGLSTGDTSLFNSLNEGSWIVLAANASQLTLVRPSGTVFSASTEVVAVAADSQFQIFSQAGVQVGDKVDLVAGFASSSRHSYPVVAVTATSLEFTSSVPLALETVVPGVGGLICYSSAKRLIYVEADQEVAVKLNGDATEKTIIQPWVSGDDRFVGTFFKVGPTYQLSIKNRSTTAAEVLVVTAE